MKNGLKQRYAKSPLEFLNVEAGYRADLAIYTPLQLYFYAQK